MAEHQSSIRNRSMDKDREKDALIGPPGPRGMMVPKVRARDTKSTLLRLLKYLKRKKWVLLLVVFLVVGTTASDVVTPYLMGKAIDDFITQGDLNGLVRIILLMIGLYLIVSLGIWAQSVIMAVAVQQVIRDMRNDLFAKIQTLTLSFFDRRSIGDLMSRLTNDMENISNVLTSYATQFAANLLMVIGVTIMMFVVNVPMAIISLVTLPIMIVISRAITARTREGFRAQQENLGKLNGYIEETITGQRVVKAYVREDKAIETFGANNQELLASTIKAQTFAGIMGPLMNLVNNLGLAVVAGAGGYLALHDVVTVGVIASFVSYARQFTRPVNQVAQMFNVVQSAIAGAERVFDLLDEQPELQDAQDAVELDRVQGSVVFDDVCFGYEQDAPVLKHVSLDTRPGTMVALVGPTGAGKTTIINLLTRFYDVNSGAIKIDGLDIRKFKRDDLRIKLGLVLQDNFMFASTVMENIRYGRLDATDEEVIAAARLANADQFIRRLPQGYQTMLSERANNLSLGQRQLLAIARAILADPDLLILDEATSNVDTRTEKNLQEALMRLMQGRTSFVIAHRLSTIRDADQVLVINGGEIIERGTHDELLAQGGFYHNLYFAQFKGQESKALAEAV